MALITVQGQAVHAAVDSWEAVSEVDDGSTPGLTWCTMYHELMVPLQADQTKVAHIWLLYTAGPDSRGGMYARHLDNCH